MIGRDIKDWLGGSSIFLTQPDMAFAVSVVSQHLPSPHEVHFEALYQILRYLKMTPGKGLFFEMSENRSIEAFIDADLVGSIEDRKSTSGYCTKVWGNLVTWRSKQQNVVSRSSAEAEFRALAHGTCELI